MMTWTDTAKNKLEGYLARLRESLRTSGADPAEVTDDIRRHISEEILAQKIEVVTADDVDRLLRRIGAPPAPPDLEGALSEGTSSLAPRPVKVPGELASPKRWHIALLVFGTIMACFIFRSRPSGCSACFIWGWDCCRCRRC
jgi:hypothetical protein